MESATWQDGPHEPIGFGGAFVRQFRFLWMSRRPALLLVGLLAVLVLSGDPWVSDSALARFLTVWPAWVIFIGPVWALAVFHNEGPGNRLYLWSQPVARDAHTLARLAAGVAWLWILYGLLIVAGLVIAGLDGNAWQLAEVSAAGWVNLFTGPLLGYLAVSVLTVPSDYPIRWLFGIIFLVPFLISLLDEWLELDTAAEWLLTPLSHRTWGLGITMVGALGESVDRIERAVIEAGGGQARGSLPDLSAWWVATPLWILLLIGVVWFLARLHPDVLPRLRRSR